MFDSYDEIFAIRADSYHAAMARWPHARDAEFAAVLAPLDLMAGLRLYDMPAGGGYLHRHLPAGVRYTAIEPAAAFVSACPAGSVIAAPIEAVPLPAGEADAIVSLAGLHHCPGLGAAFAEMRRLLRPGGLVAIADVAADTPPARFLDGFVDAHNPIGHRGHYLDDATVAVLADAGFAVATDEMVDIRWRFADRIEAGRYCAALFELADVTAVEVADAIEAEVGFDAGSAEMRWPLRRIVCRAG